MASKTNKVTEYVIDVGQAKLTVIDTPGFGDTSGIGVDKKNLEEIK